MATLTTRMTALEKRVTFLEARPGPVPVVEKPDFLASFSRNPFRTGTGDGVSDDGLWWVEQKEGQNRATIAPIGRDGGTGLRLHTEPGDNNVSGSGAHERNDAALRGVHERHEGDVDWWAHSMNFPNDFAIPPPGHWATPFDFHDLPSPGDTRVGGQANLHIFVQPNGLLRFRGAGGPVVDDGSGNQYTYEYDIGQLIRNVWFDFVYHMRWSSGSDGFMDAWLNGHPVFKHKGPTLYANCGVYLKLANYHSAWGKPSSVIHDRVVRGKTWQSVSLTPLEGVA